MADGCDLINVHSSRFRTNLELTGDKCNKSISQTTSYTEIQIFLFIFLLGRKCTPGGNLCLFNHCVLDLHYLICKFLPLLKLSNNMNSWWNLGFLPHLPTIPQVKQRQKKIKMLPAHGMFFPVTAVKLRHLQSCPRCAVKAHNHSFISNNVYVSHTP